jgi:hypothetical protein
MAALVRSDRGQYSVMFSQWLAHADRVKKPGAERRHWRTVKVEVHKRVRLFSIVLAEKIEQALSTKVMKNSG